MSIETSNLPGLKEEHELLRSQVRRFVEREVIPHAQAWEHDGHTPRPVIRRMGELGMLGMRFPESYGGADADTVASVVFAEELGRSTFGGFAITIRTQIGRAHV